jgi:hypothetical protein
MEIGEDLRRGIRRQIAESINYSVPVFDLTALKRIHDVGICSDMSAGGLCMTTGYPLQKGHILIFEEQIRNGIPASFAVVKWVHKIGKNIYRVGTQFT